MGENRRIFVYQALGHDYGTAVPEAVLAQEIGIHPSKYDGWDALVVIGPHGCIAEIKEGKKWDKIEEIMHDSEKGALLLDIDAL